MMRFLFHFEQNMPPNISTERDTDLFIKTLTLIVNSLVKILNKLSSALVQQPEKPASTSFDSQGSSTNPLSFIDQRLINVPLRDMERIIMESTVHDVEQSLMHDIRLLEGRAAQYSTNGFTLFEFAKMVIYSAYVLVRAVEPLESVPDHIKIQA